MPNAFYNKSKKGWMITYIHPITNRSRDFWLGKMFRTSSAIWSGHFTKLVDVIRYKEAIPTAVRSWLEDLPPKLHEKLASHGLASSKVSLSITLRGLACEYEASRSDVSVRTKSLYRNAADKLCEYFSEDHLISELTKQDANDWFSDLHKKLAPTTVSKVVKRAKQLFNYAVELEYIAANPFAHLQASGEVNTRRQEHVAEQTVRTVLEHIDDAEFRLIVVLARWGGLRTPSETNLLRWQDVSFEEGWIRVVSRKMKGKPNEVRYVPLFPELVEPLRRMQRTQLTDNDYVIQKHRVAHKNWGTKLAKFIKLANVTKWSKIFQNLRASRETDLVAAGYALHDVTRWLGNSPSVAMKHYLMPTEESFKRAATVSATEPKLQAILHKNAMESHEFAEKPPGEGTKKTGVLPPGSRKFVSVPNVEAPPGGLSQECQFPGKSDNRRWRDCAGDCIPNHA